MYWGYFHLGTVLLVLYLARPFPAQFHAALALLVWYVLRNHGYQHGIVETESVYLTMAVFLVLCTIGYAKHRKRLFVYLFGLGSAVCAYNGLHAHDPYWFKTVLGVLFQIGVWTVFISCLKAE